MKNRIWRAKGEEDENENEKENGSPRSEGLTLKDSMVALTPGTGSGVFVRHKSRGWDPKEIAGGLDFWGEEAAGGNAATVYGSLAYRKATEGIRSDRVLQIWRAGVSRRDDTFVLLLHGKKSPEVPKTGRNSQGSA